MSVVCASCSQVARVPLAAASAGAWTCPSCGATKPSLLADPMLSHAAVTALARDEAPQPVFSESVHRPPGRPSPSR